MIVTLKEAKKYLRVDHDDDDTVLSANPIGLVVAAIAALIAIFVTLWNNCDEFREFWIGLWEAIKSAAIAVWEALSSFFQGAWEAIVSVAQSIWNGMACPENWSRYRVSAGSADSRCRGRKG